MLDLEDEDFDALVINMFKDLKHSLTYKQMGNLNREVETTEKNQMEIILLRSIKSTISEMKISLFGLNILEMVDKKISNPEERTTESIQSEG